MGTDDNGNYVLSELERHGIRTSGVKRRGITAFTDVFEEILNPARTMFHFGGANDAFNVDDIDYSSLTQRIFHVGYLLLLKTLDQQDPIYGTRMGQMLHHAREAGCVTSLDVVSEPTDRYQTLVRPTLRYVDILIINELEASRITDLPLTDEYGQTLAENMPKALARLFEMGVTQRAVIHTPTGAFGLDAHGEYAQVPGKQLPPGWIKGTVGAGDAFCSGSLLAVYRGLSMAETLRCGHAAAIQSLRAETANGGMVTMEKALDAYDSI